MNPRLPSSALPAAGQSQPSARWGAPGSAHTFSTCTDPPQRLSSCLGPSPGFPGGSAAKESTCKVGGLSSVPGLGRSLGEGKGYPFQYSGLACIVHGSQRVGLRINLEALSLFPSLDLSRPEQFPGDCNEALSAAKGSIWEGHGQKPVPFTPSVGGAIQRQCLRPPGLGRNPSTGAGRLEGRGPALYPSHRLDHTTCRVTPGALPPPVKTHAQRLQPALG